MNKNIKKWLIGLSYFIANIIYGSICHEEVNICKNVLDFKYLFFIQTILCFASYVFSYVFYITENLFYWLAFIVFLISAYVFSGIIIFHILIPYECSSNIIGLVISQSLCFIIVSIFFVKYLICYIKKKIEENNLREVDYPNVIFHLMVLSWIIATSYFIVTEKKTNCENSANRILTLMEVILCVFCLLFRLCGIKKKLWAIYLIVVAVGIVNIITLKINIECYTPRQISSTIPVLLFVLYITSKFLCHIGLIFCLQFFDSIMSGEREYNLRDVKKRLEIIILDFPFLNLIPIKPQNTSTSEVV